MERRKGKAKSTRERERGGGGMRSATRTKRNTQLRAMCATSKQKKKRVMVVRASSQKWYTTGDRFFVLSRLFTFNGLFPLHLSTVMRHERAPAPLLQLSVACAITSPFRCCCGSVLSVSCQHFLRRARNNSFHNSTRHDLHKDTSTDN
jgi:hypothetical protein